MSPKTELYDQDFYAWTQEQVALLRAGKWHELDCEHLIEEMEDLGRSARKELRSYLEGLVMHLLKWRYQPDYQTRSWRDSIVENRARIPDCLTESSQSAPAVAQAASGVLSTCPAHSRSADTPGPGDLPGDLPLDGGASAGCRLLARRLASASSG